MYFQEATDSPGKSLTRVCRPPFSRRAVLPAAAGGGFT